MLSLLSTITPPSFSRAWFTAAHPNLPIFATCFSDKSVRIYSLTSFTLLSTISGGHKRSVRTCSWKPNLKGESVLATGSFDASVGIWQSSEIVGDPEAKDDDEDWRFAIVLDGHESEVKSVAWSVGGNLLASCSRDKSVWIWEEVGDDDFETIAVLQEHEGDVKCVAWHPEEEILASGSYDCEIRLWKEEDDWGCIAVLKGHASTVWTVDWEPIAGAIDDLTKRLVSCSDDMTIRIWDTTTGMEEARLPQIHQRAIYSVAWGDNGKIVSIGGDGRIVVYEERRKKYENSKIEDGNGLLQDTETNQGEVRAKTDWAVITQIENAHGVFEINHVCWGRRGGDEVIVTSGDDGVIKVWSLRMPNISFTASNQ